MTLHARLTTLLEGHVLARVDRHAWWCSCRADCTTVEGSYANHLASVLLSGPFGELVADNERLRQSLGEENLISWLEQRIERIRAEGK